MSEENAASFEMKGGLNLSNDDILRKWASGLPTVIINNKHILFLWKNIVKNFLYKKMLMLHILFLFVLADIGKEKIELAALRIIKAENNQ